MSRSRSCSWVVTGQSDLDREQFFLVHDMSLRCIHELYNVSLSLLFELLKCVLAVLPKISVGEGVYYVSEIPTRLCQPLDD